MTKIPLENGGYTTVADGDYARFGEHLWWKCDYCGHVIRVVDAPEGVVTRYMAAELMGISQVFGACNPCRLPKNSQNKGSMK